MSVVVRVAGLSRVDSLESPFRYKVSSSARETKKKDTSVSKLPREYLQLQEQNLLLQSLIIYGQIWGRGAVRWQDKQQ